MSKDPAQLTAAIEAVQALTNEWDVVAEAFPGTAAGIFAASHANRVRAAIDNALKEGK